MNSRTLPSFWLCYYDLPDEIRRAARKAYQLWRQNPFHPSLHFKCVDPTDAVWSVRLSLSHRALGVLDNDTVTWFWVGDHGEYERSL